MLFYQLKILDDFKINLHHRNLSCVYQSKSVDHIKPTQIHACEYHSYGHGDGDGRTLQISKF